MNDVSLNQITFVYFIQTTTNKKCYIILTITIKVSQIL